MKSFIYIPEISIYIFINIKISIKRCKNVEFFTKNALQTAKTKILFKIVEKVSKYEKNNTIHNGCWRSGPEVFLVRVLARKISGVQSSQLCATLCYFNSPIFVKILLIRGQFVGQDLRLNLGNAVQAFGLQCCVPPMEALVSSEIALPHGRSH